MKLKIGAMTIAAIAMTLIPTAAGAQDARSSLITRVSNKCLDVAGASQDDGANVMVWPCHGGGNQKWFLVGLGNGYLSIQAGHTVKCLTVLGGRDVVQSTCTSDNYTQQWRLVSSRDGYHEIRGRQNDRCLDVAYGSTADGADVMVWTCHGGANQQWKIT